MRPHPRIRKTIKWGGAAVTVLLVVVWIGSAWRELGWYTARATNVHIAGGQMGFLYFSGKGSSSAQPGLHWEPVNWPFKWWFFWVHNAYYTSLMIPCWLPLACVLPPTVVAWRRDTLARCRAKLNLCPKCGYDRTGLAAGAKCPECGAVPAGG